MYEQTSSPVSSNGTDRIAVGRESRIIELEQELNKLVRWPGEPAPYLTSLENSADKAAEFRASEQAWRVAVQSLTDDSFQSNALEQKIVEPGE